MRDLDCIAARLVTDTLKAHPRSQDVLHTMINELGLVPHD